MINPNNIKESYLDESNLKDIKFDLIIHMLRIESLNLNNKIHNQF